MEDHKLAFAASNLRDETLVNLRAEVYESNTLPAPWRTLDIGDAMDAPGTAEYMDGKVTVMTSGSDIWGTKDDLRHTFITMSGDVEITAQVARLDSVHNWAKAGVMVRDNLSDSSAHVIMAMTTGNGDAMQGRTMLGGESFSVHNSADPIKAPYFVKLIKMGNMFYGYSSPDGQLWDFVGKQEVMMTDPVQVGLAATSHVYGVYTTAEFTDIAISTEPMEPKLNFNMVIDAAKDAWYNVLTGPDDGYLSVSAAAYNTNGQPDNADDLSAMMWTAWDSTYLYMYEEVKDNVVACDNATSWQNDVLEVYLDPDPMAEVTQGQIGFHITALDSADAPEAAWPGIINLRGHNIALEATTDDYARKKVTGGYVLEVRVPWNIMLDATRGPIVPEVGTMFGMAFMNHDNDAGTREGSVSFATVLNDNIWNTPQHHGTVEFLADHKLKLSATNLRADSLVNPVAALYAPNALPEEWLAMDIGAVGTPGVFTENGGVWEITASGSDVWGTADEFSMAFQVYKGDVDVTAMVSGLTEVHEWGKAGVVIRDELTPGSAHAIMAITTTHGAAMQYRAEADGISSSIHDLDYTIDVKTPQYVKIQRLGDLFQGWISEDGKAWLKVGAVEIPMSEQIYVGLGVVSHDNAAVSKATFEKVSIKTKNINAVDEDVVAGLPTEFALNQNYPNPFNPTTTINFELPRDVKVKLTIYDILGREVTTLVDEQMEAGIHNVQFDAARYASGVYFYHLKAGDRVFSKKMMLLK
jgi:regulation of enolase protein 1 (concanavalin A-like superfamily)